MSMLKKLVAILAVLSGATALSGCVATHSGQLLISSEVAGKGVYYVEQSASDKRNLAAIIAERMQARGLNAKAGPDPVPNADYVVTYVDKWAWDMRMYLLDLRIELRDAKDRSIVGFGDSSQTSLAAMGKTYADVIDVALGELFKK
ncbi:MAG: hypothetical protein JSR54_06995 [Proteobacteria bacterium]|nr:hypothetical protein [Pseudomonadota bacterium]